MTMEMVKDGGDPQIGNLATPVNASGIVKAWINNLPAYRQGLSANNRGLEIGMAHGYYLYGPFSTSGPARGTELGAISGVLSAVGVICVLTVAISLYISVQVPKPVATVTTPNPPADFGTKEGWSAVSSGFLLGGCGGAVLAGILCQTPYLLGMFGG
ncbi:MAG: photosystem I reaction center protein subunit XI [Acaryochloridaceae cyanobacterium SU_2_1]|nr:photosystem I reaction center protein subunit XI [Acaryochloridaceae cyanobacterium SU_2_1]